MFQSSLALNANALRRNYRRLSFQQLKRLTEGRTRIYMYVAKARPEADSLSPADQLGSQLSGVDLLAPPPFSSSKAACCWHANCIKYCHIKSIFVFTEYAIDWHWELA